MAQIHLPHNHGHGTQRLLCQLEKTEDFQLLADQFRLLSDGSRLRLFWILCHCQECVTNLAAMMGMSSPALSHHLRLLRDAGLITSHREGKEVYYKAVDGPGVRVLHQALEDLMEITCPMEKKEETL